MTPDFPPQYIRQANSLFRDHMNGLRKFLFLIILLPCLQLSSAQSSRISTLLAQAKSLNAAAKEEESLQKFLQVLQLDSNQYEALWNTSILYSKIGNRLTELEQKKKYFNTARHYAQKSLRINPNDAESNYVMAAAMGRMALISGPKEKVAASRDIKKYAEKAIQLNPAHDGAWYILGKWNHEVANLNWAEKSAANLLFGGIPKGTLDEAIKDYLKAIKLSPKTILYYRDLARALLLKNYNEEAARVLNQALALKPSSQDDPSYQAQCKELLDNMKK